MQEPAIKDVMTRTVVTVSEDSPLEQALEQIAVQRISCVVVVRHRRPVGILTERDVVHLTHRRVPLHTAVDQVMTTTLTRIEEEESVLEAASLMEAHHHRRLLVTDRRGHFRGLITQSNIIQALGPHFEVCRHQVAALMTRSVFILHKETPTAAAVEEMVLKDISCVVILEDRRPVGIFTERDLANLAYRRVEWRTLPLDEVMSRPVITVQGDTTMLDAIGALQRHHVRRLLIVDGQDHFQGLLTQTGIVRTLRREYVERLKSVINKQTEIIDESEAKYRVLVDAVQVGIVIAVEQEVLFTNPTFRQLVALPDSEILGQNLLGFLHPEDAAILGSALESVKTAGRPEPGLELRFRNRLGETRFVDANLVRITFDGRPAVLATLKDITRRRQHEEEIRRLIITDELTGIFNHRHFLRELDREIDRGNRYQGTFSLLFADIDNFKQFNDTFGHLQGDQLLRAIALLLQKGVRGTDQAFRYGGEEFTILMPATPLRQAAFLAERLCRSVAATPFRALKAGQVQEITRTLSIGVAEFTPGVDAGQMISRADQAMYLAKERGKNRVECYSHDGH
ncbi:MAG: diguanylate cyclase [Thermodesulfobacteriota bacterium]